MPLSLDQVRTIARKPLTAAAEANARSVLIALARAAGKLGLDQPHRLAQFIAQVMHESGEFRHDREVWGPTPAQLGYEGRADLGNRQPGDGRKFAGHTAMQITGRANTKAFLDWCRKTIDPQAPDFLRQPELMNSDPWEGLGPLWYWSARNLNRYADQGDVENISRKINGGLNGYADRLALLARASLILLGYAPNDTRRFQQDAGLVVDGSAGPKTRAALHARLLELTGKADRPTDAAAAPVVEEKQIPVTPPALDKPVGQTGGFWERIGTIATAGSGAWALIFGDWRVAAVALGGVVVLAIVGLILHARILAAVKAIKQEIAS